MKQPDKINWKTTISGLCVLACVALYFAKAIDKEMLLTGIGICTAAGLILAKDAANN